jgi:hypothetical protein
MYWTLKRKKSISSQAASISAWWQVLLWPSIVAALNLHAPRTGEEIRSLEENRGTGFPRHPRPSTG